MSKKSIAIITIYGGTNFGNKLQNYAVHKYFTQMGFECETLAFKNTMPIKIRIERLIKKILCNVKKNGMNREMRFAEFSKNYIPIRNIAPRYYLKNLAKQYDYFSVGSDQVWNPYFINNEVQFNRMFLTFVPKEKKICFSPSFGVSVIPDRWKYPYKNALSEFDLISVREEEGVRLVKALTGKDAECLIDPTMLFDSEEWLKIAREPSEKDYVFTYFLGRRIPELLPKGKKIIDILDTKSGNYYKYNPSDFIGLIANADAVYTDSFHACVFSILFDKPFCVFERKDGNNNMSSRIQTLLSMFGINHDKNSHELIHIDIELRNKVLREKREDVKNFLSAQIKVEE